MASEKVENPTIDPFNDDLTHCIIPDFLYLGSCRSASSKSELQKLGITHILNCTGSTFNNLYPPLFKYANLNLEDRLDKKGSLLYHIDGGLKFIYSAREEEGKILVHCIEGKSRSSSIVMAYLMDSQGLSLLKSYQRVKSLRFITQPNSNFLEQLAAYEKGVWFSKYGEESSSLEETKTWLDSSSSNSRYIQL